VEYENGEKELYDLVHDPYEMENVVNVPENAELVAELSQKLKPFRK